MREIHWGRGTAEWLSLSGDEDRDKPGCDGWLYGDKVCVREEPGPVMTDSRAVGAESWKVAWGNSKEPSFGK